jgi:hypothetical protein
MIVYILLALSCVPVITSSVNGSTLGLIPEDPLVPALMIHWSDDPALLDPDVHFYH